MKKEKHNKKRREMPQKQYDVYVEKNMKKLCNINNKERWKTGEEKGGFENTGKKYLPT